MQNAIYCKARAAIVSYAILLSFSYCRPKKCMRMNQTNNKILNFRSLASFHKWWLRLLLLLLLQLRVKTGPPGAQLPEFKGNAPIGMTNFTPTKGCFYPIIVRKKVVRRATFFRGRTREQFYVPVIYNLYS